MATRSLWIGFVLLCAVSSATAQGVIRGKITDANGESLIGVAVYLKAQAGIGAATDLDGLYELHVSTDIADTLVLAYVSYTTIEAPIQLAKDEVKVMDFVLQSTSFNLTEIEVVARQERSNQYFMETIKKKSASTLDYMSGSTMRKIGDNTVAAAIARVTGVSTNGSFITVRGLGDRYVQTCINGALIPTLDPFTNNIKLDLFPAGFVDNIIITKTASADLQGDWSAAFISIETKDNPEKFSLTIESKIGFNPQTTFKPIITNETSNTDWLGFDNGFRDIHHDKFVPVQPSPSAYDEFCALGLKDYYRSLGVTSGWTPGSEAGDTYFRLGLVELGLLGKAYINDDQAVHNATAAYYAGNYQNEAFALINKEAEVVLNDFANNWNTYKKRAPANLSHHITVSHLTKLMGRPLSFLAGLRYGNQVQYDEHAYFNRTLSSNLDTLGNPFVEKRYDQAFAKYTNGWTGLLAMNYKLNANNSFSLLYMPNVSGTNSIREGVDRLGSTNFNYAFLQGQFYEERSQLIYQYKSDHYIPAWLTRFTFAASYADGASSAPDFKSLQYFSEDSITYQLDKTISNVRRNFRYLDENILDLKAGVEIQLSTRPAWISKVKIGTSYLGRERNFLQYDYLLQVAVGVVPAFQNGNLNELFADERFDIRTNSENGSSRIDMYYRKFSDPANDAIGNSKVYAGYALIDQDINHHVRMSAGVRAEYSTIFSDVRSFAELGYAADDLRRKTPEQSFILKPSDVSRLHWLPSINLIYRLKSDDLFPSHVRFNYSRSVARPSIREYTETVVRDFELNADVFGNADLKYVDINNYDFRYENYFPNQDYVSASLFYKNFKNHIELTSSNIGFTWSNADESHVYGLELEGKKKLSPRFEFSSNISIVKSFTRVEDRRLQVEDGIKSWIVLGMIERNMFGQAPYVINAILNYTSPAGFTATVSYNIQGPKLVLTSIDQAPDIYEMPRHLINVKCSQPINQHFDVSLTIKDVFNAPVRRAYRYDEGYLLDFDHFRYGTEYTVGISYSLE